jgi:hypothetical protein
LRDVETNRGAIYPNLDYNGNYRFEMDYDDGSFKYSEEDLVVTSKARVQFGEENFDFESAIFEGGLILKKGGKIYVVPKYFRPVMDGETFYDVTGGKPLASKTGAELEAYDENGTLMGILGNQTNIPGGEALGIITQVTGYDDDGNEVGFKFGEDENGTGYLDLTFNNKTETYGLDQVEIEEDTGCILVYKKDMPHTEANLIRRACVTVDQDGVPHIEIINEITGEKATGMVDSIIGTKGFVKYDPRNNNYIYVNGQPIEVNNDFRDRGFNPITGRTEAPLLQPSATDSFERPKIDEDEEPPLSVPSAPSGLAFFAYLAVLVAGVYLAQLYSRTYKKRDTP